MSPVRRLIAPPAPSTAHPATAHPASAPPGISVVIAAYRAEGTLAAAVGSALAQEPPPAEVVVVDDGSPDRTVEVAESFRDAVRVVRRPHAGEAATKNTAAREARSEVIAYLDADDVLLPGWLDAVRTAFTERPDLTLVTADAWLVRDGRRVRRVYDGGFSFAATDQRRELLRRNFVLGLCAVRRGPFLAAGGFDERVEVASDWTAWLRVVLAGGVVGCVDEPLAEYRLHDASLSADTTRLLQGRVDVLQRTLDDPNLTEGERSVLLDSLAEQRRRLALALARSGLLSGAPGARRAALRVLGDSGQPAASRLKSLVAVVLPSRVSRRFLARSDVSAAFRGGGVGGAGG
ncbi:glycosyltransferase family 2 protein [Kineococcus rhizosphaerae]|uniref:Glycosyltransferase involved in cell wall biosynthesis n=1 Tax=Kineococcus rhizosphaerae TaxID=559628 RepID=A0A2T0RB97_9ACTN|nr:glycosyltransferase family A protein [Kineococcus rhizosphaerae]PRY18435.1 glycosyltransferase involved in cell wall biosynthesis [Kineococcus rhizosphaerae]